MINNFNKTNVDLGTVKVGVEQTIHFGYNKDTINSIDEVKASCDCLDMKVEKEFHRLVIVWKPKEVPPHLISIGLKHYSTQKTITVKYTTKDKPDVQQFIILLFNAIVNK